MRSRSPSALLLALLFVTLGWSTTSAVAAVGVAPAQSHATFPDQSHATFQTQADDLSPNGTVIELQILPDGDARWTVSMRFALQDENDNRAFEQLAREFEDGDAGTNQFEAFERSRDAVSEYTGREMEFQNVSRTHSTLTSPDGNRTGVLRLSFVWTNFARVDGATIRVDDAFQTGDGSTWFSGITATETFVVRPPTGYGVDTAPTASRNSILRWDGPAEFAPEYLDITYSPRATPRRTTSPASPSSTTPPTGPTTTPPPGGEGQTLFLVGGLVGIGVIAVGVYLFARRGTRGPSPAEANGGTDSGPDDGAAAIDETAAAAGATASAADDGVDLDLLSDEERIEYLLEQNGGRMKQARIVKETGWSNAKVSQLLSSMDEDDRVDKLRIGRENLISLPDEDVTDLER